MKKIDLLRIAFLLLIRQYLVGWDKALIWFTHNVTTVVVQP